MADIRSMAEPYSMGEGGLALLQGTLTYGNG